MRTFTINEKRYKINKAYKEWSKDDKILESLRESTVKCKCDKSVLFLHNQSYKICPKCGRKVNNTTKAYFKYKLKGELEK